MLKFEKLGTNASLIKPYLKSSKISFCDISVGVKYMWREEFSVEYAIYDNTLILKESGLDYTDAFYYTMGENPIGALEQIEKYCIKNNKPLLFCCIDNATAAEFSSRYNNVQITNNRDWSDYIYEAEKFKNYSGKKLSGQRNHVNKFKKLYPNYKFKNIEKSDFSAIKESTPTFFVTILLLVVLCSPFSKAFSSEDVHSTPFALWSFSHLSTQLPMGALHSQPPLSP